ncbi:tetratricopeptide repeat protein [Acetobacteraceae bacterium H6797]|nr:tetratricopeptide repeat protein [Acetobacteraceae bacterium H6797]
MPDIFDEIQEDLRAERARKLWVRYGGVFAGAALLVLVGVGGWQGWRWYENRQASAEAALFLADLRNADAQGADLKAIAGSIAGRANEAPEGYRIVGRLRAAALMAQAGQTSEALALWDLVAADGKADPLYRDLASLMWAMHAMDQVEPGQVLARLGPLTQPGNAWRASAQELTAIAKLRQGDKSGAKAGFTALAEDVTAPQGMRERAQRMAAGIGS